MNHDYHLDDLKPRKFNKNLSYDNMKSVENPKKNEKVEQKKDEGKIFEKNLSAIADKTKLPNGKTKSNIYNASKMTGSVLGDNIGLENGNKRGEVSTEAVNFISSRTNDYHHAESKKKDV